MRATQPHWKNYWYDYRFREEGTASFEPLGPDGPRQVPNKWLATRSLEEYVEWAAGEAVDELDFLQGELQIVVYTEATPGPEIQPVLVRTVMLKRR
jgi:hypothetical protein